MPATPAQPSRLITGPFALGSLLIASVAAFPQTPTATDQITDSPAASSAPVLTLKTATRRVVVDVVVTDPKGHPVTGLTREDFSLAEDSKPQPIRSFDIHTVAAEVPYVPPAVPKLPPNTFLNLAKAPESGTPTVILYDVLNTPVSDQMYAHQEIVSFLKHRKPGTQIAIFVLSDKLHLLQGFTDDTDRLARSLGSGKGSPAQSALIAPDANSTATSIAGDAPIAGAPPTSAAAPDTNGYQAISAQTLADLTHAEQLDTSYQLDRRVDATLDALTEIGRFLSSLPGRKNVIWLSASFPAAVFPDSAITTTSLGQDLSARNYSAEIKQATDLLNLAHVAIYPVDARGLAVDNTYSAAQAPNFSRTGATITNSISTAATVKNVERSTMESIAEGTGGRAFFNTNDLQQAVDSAISNGSTYYTLSYSPTNPTFDGSLRKISVKLKQSGYTLSYRRSYFADDLNAAAQAVEDAPQNPLTPSLEYGTPLSHQLFVEAHLDAVGEPVPATPKQMELLSQYEAMRLKKKKSKTPPGPLPPVMMQQYLIQYGLIPRQLELQPTPAGAHVVSVEFAAISYDEDGRKLNGIDSKIEDTIPAPRYSQLAEEGYHVAQTVIIPVNATSVRLAVRDIRNNRIGSLEIQLPLAKTAQATAPELKPLGK